MSMFNSGPNATIMPKLLGLPKPPTPKRKSVHRAPSPKHKSVHRAPSPKPSHPMTRFTKHPFQGQSTTPEALRVLPIVMNVPRQSPKSRMSRFFRNPFHQQSTAQDVLKDVQRMTQVKTQREKHLQLKQAAKEMSWMDQLFIIWVGTKQFECANSTSTVCMVLANYFPNMIQLALFLSGKQADIVRSEPYESDVELETQLNILRRTRMYRLFSLMVAGLVATGLSAKIAVRKWDEYIQRRKNTPEQKRLEEGVISSNSKALARKLARSSSRRRHSSSHRRHSTKASSKRR